MNKKGFTLVELIAVVVIMAIIAMIATPNIINLVDNGKKSDYVSDAKTFIAKAKYMVNSVKYDLNGNNPKCSPDSSVSNEIRRCYLSELEDISDFTDSYGGEYNVDASYIAFRDVAGTDGIKQRTAFIYLESCEKDENDVCVSGKYHFIKDGNNPVSETVLDKENVVSE